MLLAEKTAGDVINIILKFTANTLT